VIQVALPLVVLLLAATAVVAWKWRQVGQPPARAPERWSESLRPESGPVVLCLGDSITHGDSARIALLVAECNAIIARVAREMGVELLPLHDRLTALLGAGRGDPRLTYRPGMRGRIQMIGAGFLYYLAGMSWDRIATRRGMGLTVDLIHLNDRAGAVVAELVEGFARQEEAAG
jgi:hypothetical protein